MNKTILTASLLSGALLLSGCGSDSSNNVATGSNGEAVTPTPLYENGSIRLAGTGFFPNNPAGPRLNGVVATQEMISNLVEILDNAGNPTNYTGPVQLSWLQNGQTIPRPEGSEEQALRTVLASDGSFHLPDDFSRVPQQVRGELSLVAQLVDANRVPMSASYTLANFYAVPLQDVRIRFIEQPTVTNPAYSTQAQLVVGLTADFDANDDGTITSNLLYFSPNNFASPGLLTINSGPGSLEGGPSYTIPLSTAPARQAVTNIQVDTTGTYTFQHLSNINSFNPTAAISEPVTLHSAGPIE